MKVVVTSAVCYHYFGYMLFDPAIATQSRFTTPVVERVSC